jgi:hypothetical protein
MSTSNATMIPTLTDPQLKRLYPLVSHRVVSLGDMAEYLDTTPNALRKRAQRLGVTDKSMTPSCTISFFKKICSYSWDNNATIEDYISDVLNNEI